MAGYDSSFSPLIKVVRFLTYLLILVSSVGLILSSLKISTVRGVPKYHAGDAITLAHPAIATAVGHHGHHHDHTDITSILFPRPTTTHHHATATHTTHKKHHKGDKHDKTTHTPTAKPTSTHDHGHSTSTKEPKISVSSFPAPIPSPHPDPFPAPGGHYTYCKTDKGRLIFFAVAGLVSSTLILHLLFVFPTLSRTFFSHFWLEIVVLEVLTIVWFVVAFLSLHESDVLDTCTRDAWRKPALLAFAWSGAVLCLLSTLGLIAVALLEKRNGNDHVWKANVNSYIFGEHGVRLGEDDGVRAPLVGGH